MQSARVQYTCPMHPIRYGRDRAIARFCDMVLEPRTVSAQEEGNPELRNMTRGSSGSAWR